LAGVLVQEAPLHHPK